MKYLICTILLLLLSGCSQTPSQFVLAPSQQINETSANNNTFYPLTIEDLRAAQHLIQIHKKGDPIKVLASNQNIKQVLKNDLIKRLNAHKATFHGASYQLNIKEMLITVDQHSLKYESNSRIQLQIIITNDNNTLTKNFKRNGNSYGPLTADLAVLERDFNLLLGQMLDDIVQDAELNDALAK